MRTRNPQKSDILNCCEFRGSFLYNPTKKPATLSSPQNKNPARPPDSFPGLLSTCAKLNAGLSGASGAIQIPNLCRVIGDFQLFLISMTLIFPVFLFGETAREKTKPPSKFLFSRTNPKIRKSAFDIIKVGTKVPLTRYGEAP